MYARQTEEGRKVFVDQEGMRARPWESVRRVLQAAAVEAHGRPGAYVTRDLVMRRANMVDTEHFRTIAKYLEERGWIAEADVDYGVFVVTASGIDKATG
jgi:RIO-like serine/threonine protein kinase